MRPVIITVAPTGGMLTKREHPSVPTQPEDIAADVAACVEAGASAAALHVRTADDLASCDPDLYRRVNHLVRTGTDVVLNNSSGGGVSVPMRAPLGDGMSEISWPQRLAAVDGGAEIVTLDAITAWASIGGEEVLMNTPPSRARELAARIAAAGARPEWEVFNPAQVTRDIPEVLAEVDDGWPPIVNLCLGIDGVFTNAVRWSPALLAHLVDSLPGSAVFSVSVGGRTPWEALAQAVVLGGHIRVGVEDHPFDETGAPRSNLDLVEQAVRLVRALGHRPATVDETRELWHVERRGA